MLANLLLAAVFQVGPFYEQRTDYYALRPLWSCEGDTTDVLWPVFTAHRDWWRFCWFTHYQEGKDGSFQFEVMPLWFNGKTRTGEDYWGLFPIYGHHPHFLLLHDWDFCLWPVWMRYRMPRPSKNEWMTSNAVLFPFFSWRDDGSWGFWPFYGVSHQRESDHQYALWPLVTWASYREDRDTGGAGSSWMFWPIWGSVDREREKQTLFLPPFFSWTETYSKTWAEEGNSGPEIRLRCPWPLVEYESRARRERLSVFPFYERERERAYGTGAVEGGALRFGWRLVEVYYGKHDEVTETRVFPFWKDNVRHRRIWPFYESMSEQGRTWRSVLALFPITWADSVDRNWAPYWTFYGSVSDEKQTDHSLLWGIIRWRTEND